MKLLVIGGTRFLGRHAVEYALAHGHEVTLFHRGRTGEGLFPVEEILGDRDGEIDKLGGRKWDAVLDTCGYFPRVVEQSAYQLCDEVGIYCFISSISVYQEKTDAQIVEGDSVLKFEGNPPKEEITNESYGPFKALCEDAVTTICGDDKALIIRPGLIVGPHDPTDRFTYWIDRFGRRGPVLVPDRANQPIQLIDVRDLAEFLVRAMEEKTTGTFNLTGPARSLTIGEVWTICRMNCGGLPEEVIVSDQFLAENDVKDWADLPFVASDAGLMNVDITKAIRRGLTLRDLDETVSDTSKWHRGRDDVELKAGMSREREAELITRWRSSV